MQCLQVLLDCRSVHRRVVAPMDTSFSLPRELVQREGNLTLWLGQRNQENFMFKGYLQVFIQINLWSCLTENFFRSHVWLPATTGSYGSAPPLTPAVQLVASSRAWKKQWTWCSGISCNLQHGWNRQRQSLRCLRPASVPLDAQLRAWVAGHMGKLGRQIARAVTAR